MADRPDTGRNVRARRLRALALVVALVGGLVFGLAAPAAAATPQVVPLVNCFYQHNDGSITVVLGYRSTYSSTQTFAVGTRNYASPSRLSSSLPTSFKPGTNNGVATLRISAHEIPGARWYLDGTALNYWSTGDRVPLCTQAQLPAFANAAALTTLLVGAGIAGVLVVRRARRATLDTRPVGSVSAPGGDHA